MSSPTGEVFALTHKKYNELTSNAAICAKLNADPFVLVNSLTDLH
jgi:hypothetical protein